ncbi:MAG: Winged helix DNA-binding domain [Thermoleophilia bacterium]|nr:Winged helix DNA-binding domain [Thermoleophilia bacterium]
MSDARDIPDVARTLGIVAAWRSSNLLTAHQGEVLIQVHAAGAITAAQVCRVIGLTTASMTRIVGKLEEAGWLMRARDDSDARRLILQPTKQLARAIEELERALVPECERPDVVDDLAEELDAG